MKYPATSTPTSTRPTPRARTSLSISPTAGREVAAFHLPTSGRNLARCRYTKPLPPRAVKVSTVIRNKGQPGAEACLESVRQTACHGGDKQTAHSSLVVRSKSFVRYGLQDQTLNVHTKILSTNYFDIAKVKITSKRMMNLENKKNAFLTHPRALC